MFDSSKYPGLKRAKWLEESERELTQEELERCSEEWIALLGLNEYGVQVIKASWQESCLIPYSPRYFELKASNERTLLHELLHLLLSKRDWLLRRIREKTSGRKSTKKDKEDYSLWNEIWDLIKEKNLKVTFKWMSSTENKAGRVLG